MTGAVVLVLITESWKDAQPISYARAVSKSSPRDKGEPRPSEQENLRKESGFRQPSDRDNAKPSILLVF